VVVRGLIAGHMIVSPPFGDWRDALLLDQMFNMD